MLYISFNYTELHRLKEAVFAPHMVNAGFNYLSYYLYMRSRFTEDLARIDHRFGNEGDFGRPERFSESFAIDPVQVE